MKLYHALNSVCSQKARLCLAEIGIAYDDHFIDLVKGDQFAPDYLKLNADAVVPTLVDGDRVIVESSLICAYLDEQYNEGRLTPDAAQDRIAVAHWLLRCLALHAMVNALTFSTANRGTKFDKNDTRGREAWLGQMPNPLARLRLASLTDDGLDSAFVSQALVDLERAQADMGKQLRRAPWLSGDEYGLADIAVCVYFDRLERLGFAPLWEVDNPEISGWLERIRTRPAFKAAIIDPAPPGSFERLRRLGSEHLPALLARRAALATA